MAGKKIFAKTKGLTFGYACRGSISLRPMSISSMLEPLDLEVGAIVPTRSGESYILLLKALW